jgi:hypothetical protein
MFEVKKAPFTDLNPNGRTPAIVDHNNNDFVLWEASYAVVCLMVLCIIVMERVVNRNNPVPSREIRYHFSLDLHPWTGEVSRESVVALPSQWAGSIFWARYIDAKSIFEEMRN